MYSIFIFENLTHLNLLLFTANCKSQPSVYSYQFAFKKRI